MKMEEWRDVVGYEGLYKVSNLGNIYSFYVNRILSKHLMPNGYITIRLCNNSQHKRVQLGRIVAIAFIPNPDNLSEVNHKDCNPRNNESENLEWCTHAYNINYANRTQKMLNSPGYKAAMSNIKIPILQFDKNGTFIRRWNSGSEIEKETCINAGNISLCCSGKRKSAGNYIWRYEQQCA